MNNLVLLLGGNSQEGRHRHSWFWPLFYYGDDGSLASVPEKAERYDTYGKTFWCLPFCWYQNQLQISPATSPSRERATAEPPDASGTRPAPARSGAITNAPPVRRYSRKQGAFPFWSYANYSTPASNKSEVKGSVGIFLYDYRHEAGPTPGENSGGTNDYTRARVLWRLWHYERRNGDVSADVFPAITYDRKTDGFKKTSFLWRFFRYEHVADGTTKLDVLFVPLRR